MQKRKGLFKAISRCDQRFFFLLNQNVASSINSLDTAKKLLLKKDQLLRIASTEAFFVIGILSYDKILTSRYDIDSVFFMTYHK